MRLAAAIMVLAASGLFADSAKDLIGTPAPEWKLDHWQNSPPLHLKDLRGKVVLIRWWMAPDCPYCQASAPALNDFYREYHSQGLEVIGAYHHKGDDPVDPAKVAKQAKQLGFRFPFAIDTDWQTLKSWWLNDPDHHWTSVSFLIDRRGIIRHIHPGGQYVKGDAAYRELKTAIESALRDK